MVIPAGQHGAYRQQIKLSERALTLFLMVNMNKYRDGEYPTSDAYKSYMKILPKILTEVAGKVLWQVPILGQPVGLQAADEIFGIWYPSHKSFLVLRTASSYDENF